MFIYSTKITYHLNQLRIPYISWKWPETEEAETGTERGMASGDVEVGEQIKTLNHMALHV